MFKFYHYISWKYFSHQPKYTIRRSGNHNFSLNFLPYARRLKAYFNYTFPPI